KARNLAVKIERYNKDNEFDVQKAKALKISRVEKKTDSDIQRIKDEVKELTKAVKDLMRKEGHMSRNCPEKVPGNDSMDKTDRWQHKEKGQNKENEEQKGPNENQIEARDQHLLEVKEGYELSKSVELQRLTLENIHLLNFGPNLSSKEKQYISQAMDHHQPYL
ncbi:13509_t:CDS:2, partial [Cetraspora pellucida]